MIHLRLWQSPFSRHKLKSSVDHRPSHYKLKRERDSSVLLTIVIIERIENHIVSFRGNLINSKDVCSIRGYLTLQNTGLASGAHRETPPFLGLISHPADVQIWPRLQITYIEFEKLVLPRDLHLCLDIRACNRPGGKTIIILGDIFWNFAVCFGGHAKEVGVIGIPFDWTLFWSMSDYYIGIMFELECIQDWSLSIPPIILRTKKFFSVIISPQVISMKDSSNVISSGRESLRLFF